MKAYPFSHRHPTTGVTTSSEGMDLRDYFAAQAMRFSMFDRKNYESWDEVAKASYKMADAMLEARERRNEQS